MNEAERATANAISFEAKKDGLVQRNSGDWRVSFTVQGIDMNPILTAAPMGTRFACVLVEINDDETPVDHRVEDRDKWRDLGPTRQAGIRCKEPMFWSFLREELHFDRVMNEGAAAVAVRHHCGVESRRDLEKVGNSEARLKWYGLDNGFQAWKVRENA
jgi:hypothetical protein